MGAVASSKVRTALAVLGTLVAWLVAAVDPAELRPALDRQEPGLRVSHVPPKRLRLDDAGHAWTGRYQVTLDRPDGTAEDVALSGTLHPPGVAPPASGAPKTPFGSSGGRRVLPELGLERTSAPAGEAALPALPVLTDP